MCYITLQLQEVPGLVERMASLMCVDVDLNSEAEETGDEDEAKMSAAEIVEREFCQVKEKGVHSIKWLELEDLDIDDSMLVSIDLPSKFPVSFHLAMLVSIDLDCLALTVMTFNK